MMFRAALLNMHGAEVTNPLIVIDYIALATIRQ